MQLTLLSCPSCRSPLGISCDMWGDFYVCEECGFTAEDDDELKPQPNGDQMQVPVYLVAQGSSGFYGFSPASAAK